MPDNLTKDAISQVGDDTLVPSIIETHIDMSFTRTM